MILIRIKISRDSLKNYFHLNFSSAKVYFKEKIRFAGIQAYHFETGSDFLENIGPEFGDGCFCIDKIPNIPVQSNGCLYKGAMDLSTCQGKVILMHATYVHGIII